MSPRRSQASAASCASRRTHRQNFVLSGSTIVGLAILPTHRAMITTTNALYTLDWDVEGYPPQWLAPDAGGNHRNWIGIAHAAPAGHQFPFPNRRVESGRHSGDAQVRRRRLAGRNAFLVSRRARSLGSDRLMRRPARGTDRSKRCRKPRGGACAR